MEQDVVAAIHKTIKRIHEGIIGNGAYRAGCGKGCRQNLRIRIFYPVFGPAGGAGQGR